MSVSKLLCLLVGILVSKGEQDVRTWYSTVTESCLLVLFHKFINHVCSSRILSSYAGSYVFPAT